MPQIIIGLVGPIASGKGVLVDHLKQNNFKVFSLSDKVREEAISRGFTTDREILQNLGNELREKYGNQILAERVTFDLIGEEGNIVIDSIRNPGEIEYLRNHFDIKIIGVDATPELRYGRYLQRAKERGEDVPDLEHFFKASMRDQGMGEKSTGQQVHLCLEAADFVVQNNSSKSEVLAELDKYLQKEFRFDPEIHRFSKEK